MEKQLIRRGVLRGTVHVPSSKSISHRCFILAALSCQPCVVLNPLKSDDLDITLTALQQLGYEAVQEGRDVRFTGKRRVPTHSEEPVRLYMHHSGTSARLLTAVAALQPFVVEIDGSARMRERPMQDLFTPLEQLGARLEYERRPDGGGLPVRILEPVRSGGRVRVNASKSSQFLSALLHIGAFLNSELIVEVEGAIASQSYSDMTIAQMRKAGLTVIEEQSAQGLTVYRVPSGQRYGQEVWAIEGDYSAASYPIAGAALSGGDVLIPNLEEASLQGDSAIVEIVRSFGATAVFTPEGLRVSSSGILHGITRDMNSCPDIVPTVAVMAMFADSMTRLENVEHLRYKESDRLAAVIGNIKLLGGCAYVEGSTLVVEPVAADCLHGAVLPTFDDHRMAMAFSLAGLKVDGVEIENPSCVAKSYPEYWRDFEVLCQ